jgi:hypothetical protein
MWLKYLLSNLQMLEESWAVYLAHWTLENEDQFNTNKYRGALFFLNFHANEKQRYLKKLKKLKRNAKFIPESENLGRAFALGDRHISLVTDRESIRSESDFGETVHSSFLINEMPDEFLKRTDVENYMTTQKVQEIMQERGDKSIQDIEIDFATIEMMQPDVKRIFFKIKEQLGDRNHPL